MLVIIIQLKIIIYSVIQFLSKNSSSQFGHTNKETDKLTRTLSRAQMAIIELIMCYLHTRTSASIIARASASRRMRSSIIFRALWKMQCSLVAAGYLLVEAWHKVS